MPTDIIQFPTMPYHETRRDDLALLLNDLPLPFLSPHCEPARLQLGWSIDALAFRSGVSPGAIRCVENGAELRRVTMQALAYAMEMEGLVFFPGHPPMRADNCRGATPDPRSRGDYHLLE